MVIGSVEEQGVVLDIEAGPDIETEHEGNKQCNTTLNIQFNSELPRTFH